MYQKYKIIIFFYNLKEVKKKNYHYKNNLIRFFLEFQKRKITIAQSYYIKLGSSNSFFLNLFKTRPEKIVKFYLTVILT